eukprot:2236453-Pyramimonas_sp.AAC.1
MRLAWAAFREGLWGMREASRDQHVLYCGIHHPPPHHQHHCSLPHPPSPHVASSFPPPRSLLSLCKTERSSGSSGLRDPLGLGHGVPGVKEILRLQGGIMKHVNLPAATMKPWANGGRRQGGGPQQPTTWSTRVSHISL